MKRFVIFFFSIFCVYANANNIIVNGTRFIYPGNEKEITVQLSNTAERPALAQAWLDNGNPDATPDTITTPFIISPPISRVDAKSGQTLRIKLGSRVGLSTNKETLWWLNILEIPPVVKGPRNEGDNVLQLAIRSRFKFIYRPSGLGNRDTAAESISISTIGNKIKIKNPTPFYLTVSKISREGGKALNDKPLMLSPVSENIMKINDNVKAGEKLTISNINDYGADTLVKLVVN